VGERNRLGLLILVLVVVTISVAGIAVALLYRAAIVEERGRLMETAQSQARLIESVARHERDVYSAESTDTSQTLDLVLALVADAHSDYDGFGETGEFTLALQEEGMIIFLLSHRHYDLQFPRPVPVDSVLAEPMRMALSGRSGTLIGLDYRGVYVLAAYEPVSELDLGIVAKIDLKEVRAPFIRAALIALGSAVGVIALGVLLFTAITNPLIRRLASSETRYRSYIDNAPTAVFVADNTGKYLDVNEAACRLTGYARDELLQMEIGSLFHEKDRENWSKQFNEIPKSGQSSTELQIVQKNSLQVWCLVSAVTLPGERMMAFCSDITERKQAELALTESEERFRDLYEQAPIAYQSLDSQGNLVDVNRPWLSLLGYEREEVIGKWFGEFLMPDQLEHFRTGFPTFRAANRVTGVEFVMLTKRGNPLQVSIDGKVGHSTDGAFKQTHCVVHDVGAQRVLESHLRQQQKLESIGTLASGVAHEINNPLMGMINYADLIDDKADDETIKEYSQVIMTEGNRIATIVRDLLSFSRQDREAHSPARIKDIIESSISLVGSTLRKDQISIELDIAEDLPQLKCRTQQIQQVIINLLTNAHDALIARYPGYDDNKLVRITVRLFEKEGENWIRTTIEDHGIGISEDVAQRIFDPFFTTKPKDEGTGLGLSVSFGIVREHHGELTVESVAGEFTRFHMDLRVNNGWSHRNNQKEHLLPSGRR
jgi:PAS domain S-box-containing protein